MRLQRTSLEHHKIWTNFHHCRLVRCYCSFREESKKPKGKDIKNTSKTWRLHEFLVWIPKEERMENSDPNMHKLTLFILGGFGKGRGKSLCSSYPGRAAAGEKRW
jgi:hypothetical protein